jgi:hypothetical protein
MSKSQLLHAVENKKHQLLRSRAGPREDTPRGGQKREPPAN